MTQTLLGPDNRAFTFSTMSLVGVAAYNNLSVTAALPSIGDAFGNLRWLPWIITVELVGAAVATVAVGPVIDAIGARRTLQFVLGLFLVSSSLCALAPNLWFLIGARGLQGVAAGGIISTVLAAMGLAVPPPLRARAYAANSTVWGVMGVAGPAIAAGLLVLFGWRGIFIVNIPVALFAAAVGWNAFPGPQQGETKVRHDGRGLLLMGAFTFLTLVAISTINGWTLPILVGSVLLIAAYVLHERRSDSPVLRVVHITRPDLRWLHLTAILVVTAGTAANVFLPLYVKGVRNASTAGAAFVVVFFTVGWTLGAYVASKAADSIALERIIFLMAMVEFGALIGATIAIATGASLWLAFPFFLLIGLGIGGVSSTGVAALQGVAAPNEMGRVNSAHQFLRSLGFTYGAAIGGAVLFAVVVTRLGDADAVRDLLADEVVDIDVAATEALERGFTLSMIVATVIGGIALVAADQLRRHQTFPVATR